MRLLALAGGIALVSTVALAAASSSSKAVSASFAFGLRGGNVVPFTATISRTGQVTVTQGGKRSRRPRLSVAAVRGLFTLARAERFFALPKEIDCSGVLPDVAAEFVRVRTAGRTRTVTERGSCSRRFEELYAVLAAAVRPPTP